jgi:hypothetical protein
MNAVRANASRHQTENDNTIEENGKGNLAIVKSTNYGMKRIGEVTPGTRTAHDSAKKSNTLKSSTQGEYNSNSTTQNTLERFQGLGDERRFSTS